MMSPAITSPHWSSAPPFVGNCRKNKSDKWCEILSNDMINMRSKLFVHSSLFTGIQKDQKAQPVLRVRCWWWCCRSRFKVLTRRRQQLPLEHCAELPRHQLFNPDHGNYGNPVTRHGGEYSTPPPRQPLAFLYAIRICQDAGVLHITSSWHWQSCLNHYFPITFFVFTVIHLAILSLNISFSVSV